MRTLALLSLMLAPKAFALGGGMTHEHGPELFYSGNDAAEDDDLLRDEDDGGLPVVEEDGSQPPPKVKERLPRAVYLEPIGLSVVPVIAYGMGVEQVLLPSVALRLRYQHGSASMGSLHVVTEVTTLEAAWNFYRSAYLAVGPVYRHVRGSAKDIVEKDESELSASTSVVGVSTGVGVAKDIGRLTIGCDLVGAIWPVKKARQRGPEFDEIDTRDPYVEKMDAAANGRSTYVLRLFAGPRF